MMKLWGGLLLAALPAAAVAQDLITAMPYEAVMRIASDRIGFETLPQTPEPGIELRSLMRFEGAWVGEHLAGQDVIRYPIENETVFDHLQGVPLAPLRAVAGAENLSVAYHRGFESNAALPLGPAGFDAIEGRGEGAMSVVFDHGQAAIGLKIHAEYESLLGIIKPVGLVEISFYQKDGGVIATEFIIPDEGVNALGYQSSTPIHAITITNTDPGGIAIDDILFQTAPLMY